MEFAQLEAFVAVAEELHFGRAADRLHIAQSPLSQKIKRLEAEVGVPLFQRTTRRVELLPAGQTFLASAREILRASQLAARDARAAADGERGQVSLGLTGAMTYALMPMVTKALRARLPDITLQLHGELLSPALAERLAKRELDVAILRPPIAQRGLRVERLGTEPLVLALPQGHPLAALEHVPVKRLADENFVTYPKEVSGPMTATCEDNGFVPNVVMEVAETSTMVSFVAAGVGVALLPGSAQLLSLAGVTYRPILGGRHHLAIAMAWREDNASPLIDRVLEVIRDEVADLRLGRSRFSVATPQLSDLLSLP